MFKCTEKTSHLHNVGDEERTVVNVTFELTADAESDIEYGRIVLRIPAEYDKYIGGEEYTLKLTPKAQPHAHALPTEPPKHPPTKPPPKVK